MKSRTSQSVIATSEGDSIDAHVLAHLPSFDSDCEGFLCALPSVLPTERILTRPEDLFAYDCDGQTLDRARPLAVVFPESTAEVTAIVKLAVKHNVPFVPRGAGTGLSGGAIAIGSLVVATARLNRIETIDIPNRQAWVGPGVVNAHLSRAVASDGLHYAPDPSSQNACTIGGNVAENAGGPHTLKYGVTCNHVLALEVVMPDGSIAEIGDACPEFPGYDLVSAFVGSEGTFGIVTRVLVRLVATPEGVRTLLAIFDSVSDACRGVTEILSAGIVPAAIEMIDQPTLRAVEQFVHMGLPLDAAAVLLVEVDGLHDELELQLERAVGACKAVGAREIRHARDEAERLLLWKARKQAFGALGRIAPNYYTHDGVIPRTRLPEVLEAIASIGVENDIMIANVFHAGDGNLHPVILFDERVPGVIERVRKASDAILLLVLKMGGTLSGEHGIGIEKIGYMSRQFTEADLDEMRRLRQTFNPQGLCNPGKVLPAPGRCVETGHGLKKRPVGL